MTSTEARALHLAGKITKVIGEADTPNRNARSILTDASVWTAISSAIIDAIEGNDAEEIEEQEQAGEEQNGNEGGASEDDETPRRRRRRS